MAKQNAATDPVSAAMSAIESALNLTDDDEAVTVDSARRPPARPRQDDDRNPGSQAKPAHRRALDAAPPGPRASPIAPETEAKPAIQTSAPANDDRETVGAILQAMNARPASRTPFILALIGSLLWAAICVLYAYVALWPSAPARPVETPAAAGDAALPAGDAGADLLHVLPSPRSRGACASSGSRRARSPRSPCVLPSPRRRPASTWRTSLRPFVASLRRWAMGSNGRLRAPPNSRPGCSPRFRPSSAPIPTMSAGSGC